MWTPWKKSEPAPVVGKSFELQPRVTFEDIAPAPQVRILTQKTVLLKKLKWVSHKGKIGIVWELDSSGYAVIHYTDAEGQTVAVDRVNATELVLAKFAEIPAKRRGAMTPQYAATLGYF